MAAIYVRCVTWPKISWICHTDQKYWLSLFLLDDFKFWTWVALSLHYFLVLQKQSKKLKPWVDRGTKNIYSLSPSLSLPHTQHTQYTLSLPFSLSRISLPLFSSHLILCENVFVEGVSEPSRYLYLPVLSQCEKHTKNKEKYCLNI
jgi:hypothetical protein